MCCNRSLLATVLKHYRHSIEHMIRHGKWFLVFMKMICFYEYRIMFLCFCRVDAFVEGMIRKKRIAYRPFAATSGSVRMSLWLILSFSRSF